MTKTLLIADDDLIARTILSDILRASGYDVIAAQSGEEAFDLISTAAIQNAGISMACFDMQLGDTTGIELVRRIRATYPKQNFPVVFISANSQTDIAAIHGDEDVDYYIEKPFTAATILPVVERLIGKP